MRVAEARLGVALALLLIASPATGCGRQEREPVSTGAIVGRIEVPAEQRAPLALSATAGYGGVTHVARARGAFAVRGSVQPGDSRVTVLDTRTGATVRAAVGRRGAFTARVRAVRPGATAYVVSATRPGRLRWAENLMLVREGASIEPSRSVVVPERDLTPPVAIVRLSRADPGGRRSVVAAFTPTQSKPGRPVLLDGTTLDATGEMRDANAGALRVRVTVTADLFCRDARTGEVRRRRKLWRRPPAAIERLVVPPGRTLPTTLRRRVRIDLVGRDCGNGAVVRVDGQVEADATNAFELEEATPIYFSARP